MTDLKHRAQRCKKARPYPRVSLTFTEPSMTHQAQADECDINSIIKKYTDTGVVSHINTEVGQYGDFSNVASYRESLDQMKEAERLFLETPASVRKFFNNDPIEFISYCSNPDNIDKLRDLGLAPKIEKPPVAAPDPVPVPDPNSAPAE